MKRFQIRSLEFLINFINSLQVVYTDSRFRQIFINIFLIQLLVASTGFVIFEIILKKNTKPWQQSSLSVCVSLCISLTHRHTHTMYFSSARAHSIHVIQTHSGDTYLELQDCSNRASSCSSSHIHKGKNRVCTFLTGQ